MFQEILVKVLFFGLLLHSTTVHATNYNVGDSDTNGWRFNVAGWENNKKFTTGDTLTFNYQKGAHNVIVVDKSGYDNCLVPANPTKYDTGKDQITLAKGTNYFICGFPGHCQSGMKIAANAA